MKRLDQAISGLGDLARDRHGGIALWLAVSILPLALMIGAATDMTRWAAARSATQAAADSAALAAAQAFLTSASNDHDQRLREAQAAADAAMAANLGPNAALAQGVAWTVSAEPNARHVTLAASGRSPNAFGALFGMSSLGVNVSSTASAGARRMEVVLVLDNTGSMKGRKLALLKHASRDFVDQLEAVAARSEDPDAVRIAVAPFSMTVNVGSQYAGADWIDRHARSPIHAENFSAPANRFTLLQQVSDSWDGCVESRPYPHDVRGTAPSSASGATLYVPYFAPDEPAGFGNDYLSDLPAPTPLEAQENVLKYDLAATGGARRGPGGPNAGCELTPLQRLTTDGHAVKRTLNAMSATGNTNIPMGLAWGWNLLAPDGPFGDGADYDREDTLKVVVLMTDGLNNISRIGNFNGAPYSGIGYPTKHRLGENVGAASSIAERRAALDRRMGELCANIKQRNVVIYAMGVEVPGPNPALRDCASSPGHFTEVQDAADLQAAFDQIARSILALRLSR